MTTEAQIESCAKSRDTADIQGAMLASLKANVGLTADEWFLDVFPGMPFTHSVVDTFRVVIRKLREGGKIRDTGLKRPNYDGSRSQTVWGIGDDRHLVERHRRAKLRKFPTSWLRDELLGREASA